jgi:hypothetical protein
VERVCVCANARGLRSTNLRLPDGLGPEGLDAGKAAAPEHTVDPFHVKVVIRSAWTNLGPFPATLVADWLVARLEGKSFKSERWFVEPTGRTAVSPL